MICIVFKRKDEKRWRGPGTVIGQDDQFVLIRHQTTTLRAHPCRLQLVQNEEAGPVINQENNTDKQLAQNEEAGPVIKNQENNTDKLINQGALVCMCVY